MPDMTSEAAKVCSEMDAACMEHHQELLQHHANGNAGKISVPGSRLPGGNMTTADQYAMDAGSFVGVAAGEGE